MEKAKRKFLIFIIIFSFLMLVISLLFLPFFKNLMNSDYQERFSLWVKELGFKGVLILFGLQVLQIVIAVIPGGPTQVIAGAAFGTWKGLLILEAGCIAGTIIIFFLVRKFGKPLLLRFFGEDLLSTWGFLSSEKKTATVTFILFLLPGMPKDFLTYFAPLTRLSLVQFTLISALARFPAMLASTVMGDSVIQKNWFLFLLVFGITALAGILGIQFKDKIVLHTKKRMQHDVSPKQTENPAG